MVHFFGKLFPDVAVRQVFDQLYPVAATPQVDKAHLVGERVVEHLRQSRVFVIPEGSVIEGQPLVLDGDDDPPGAPEDLDVVAAFLIASKACSMTLRQTVSTAQSSRSAALSLNPSR